MAIWIFVNFFIRQVHPDDAKMGGIVVVHTVSFHGQLELVSKTISILGRGPAARHLLPLFDD